MALITVLDFHIFFQFDLFTRDIKGLMNLTEILWKLHRESKSKVNNPGITFQDHNFYKAGRLCLENSALLFIVSERNPSLNCLKQKRQFIT